MRIRRKNRPKTQGSWTKESSALAHAAKARKRMVAGLRGDLEMRRVPAGDMLGTLQWHAADGTVRRWVIRQGQRMNGIRVCAKGKMVECGWDRLFRSLRPKLAVPKRVLGVATEPEGTSLTGVTGLTVGRGAAA